MKAIARISIFSVWQARRVALTTRFRRICLCLCSSHRRYRTKVPCDDDASCGVSWWSVLFVEGATKDTRIGVSSADGGLKGLAVLDRLMNR